MVYEASRSASAIHTRAGAVGVTHATSLSRLTAPPATRETSGCVAGCGVFAALGVWAVSGTMADIMVKPTKALPYLPIFVGLIAPGIVLFLVWLMFRGAARQEEWYERNELPGLLEAWRSRWLCHQCGVQFTPD